MEDGKDHYTRNVVVTKIYDGDTITVDVDLGWGVWTTGQKLRLYGINTPEVRGVERPQGLVSRDWLRTRLEGQNVAVRTRKSKNKGKYGRWLAEVFVDGVNVNEEMVQLGLAKEYMKV